VLPRSCPLVPRMHSRARPVLRSGIGSSACSIKSQGTSTPRNVKRSRFAIHGKTRDILSPTHPVGCGIHAAKAPVLTDLRSYLAPPGQTLRFPFARPSLRALLPPKCESKSCVVYECTVWRRVHLRQRGCRRGKERSTRTRGAAGRWSLRPRARSPSWLAARCSLLGLPCPRLRSQIRAEQPPPRGPFATVLWGFAPIGWVLGGRLETPHADRGFARQPAVGFSGTATGRGGGRRGHEAMRQSNHAQRNVLTVRDLHRQSGVSPQG